MKKLFLWSMVLLLIPAVVYGHVYMMECYPPEDAVLYESPEKVTITFAGSVEPVFSKIEVFDSDGNKVSKETVCKESDTIMEAELETNLPPGKYTVQWRCMSLDGHKQSGEFHFSVKPK